MVFGKSGQNPGLSTNPRHLHYTCIVV